MGMETDKPDEPGKEEFNPPGVEGVVARFLQDQEAEKQSAAKNQPPTKEPAAAPAEAAPSAEPKEEPAPPEKKSAFRLVNEKGETILDRFKSDGKEILLDDPEALKTYLGFGYHHNATGEDLKRREEALQKEIDAFKQADPLIGKVLTAIQEGRLKIVEPGGPAKEADEPGTGESEEDKFADPATVKLKTRLTATEKALETTRTELNSLRDAYNMQHVERVTKDMATKIADAKKNFKFADDDQVWTFLAETDEQGKLKYTEEQAVKMSHDSQVKKFQGWLSTEHPEFAKASESQRKEIIAEYIEGKAKKEEAPVGKPSGIPVVEPKKAEKEFKSLHEAVAAGYADLGVDMEAAKKL